MNAEQEARRIGRTYGWISVPGNGKESPAWARYADLWDEPWSEELHSRLWDAHADAPGLGVVTDELVQIEADSEEGEAGLQKLGVLQVRTPWFRGPRGFPKGLFRAPQATLRTGEGALGPGVEVLHHKLMLLPPTPRYVWLPSLSLWDVELRVLPARIAAKVIAPPSAPAAEYVARTFTGSTPFGLSALKSEIARVLGASIGTRNTALNKASFALGQLIGGGELDETLVRRALGDAAEHIGLAGPAESRATARTISSGLVDGMREPRSSRKVVGIGTIKMRSR